MHSVLKASAEIQHDDNDLDEAEIRLYHYCAAQEFPLSLAYSTTNVTVLQLGRHSTSQFRLVFTLIQI